MRIRCGHIVWLSVPAFLFELSTWCHLTVVSIEAPYISMFGLHPVCLVGILLSRWVRVGTCTFIVWTHYLIHIDPKAMNLRPSILHSILRELAFGFVIIALCKLFIVECLHFLNTWLSSLCLILQFRDLAVHLLKVLKLFIVSILLSWVNLFTSRLDNTWLCRFPVIMMVFTFCWWSCTSSFLNKS